MKEREVVERMGFRDRWLHVYIEADDYDLTKAN